MVFTVSPPFDSDPGADAVIISCDNFIFQVRRAILSLASPFFDSLLSLPQSQPASVIRHEDSSSQGTSLPSIRMPETGFVVDIILRYCYPVATPGDMDNYTTLIAIRTAAEKYEMDFLASKVDEYIKGTYCKNSAYCLLLYRAAYNKQQENESRFYARDCLKLSYSSLVRHWPASTLDESLANLIEYHESVSEVVIETITDSQFICKNYGVNICSSCCIQEGNSTTSTPRWWKNNLTICLRRIVIEGPFMEHILIPGSDVGSMLCSKCASSTFKLWDTLEHKLQRTLKNAIGKVCHCIEDLMCR